MDAKLIVIIAGAILMLAILISLFVLRSYSGRFTFDTITGTRPKASEGEGNTSGSQLKGRFQILSFAAGASLVALITKLWSMQMVSSDHYETLSEENRTRTVTTAAPRGRILDRDGVELVTNRATLNVSSYRSLADDTVTVRHLANVLGLPYIAVMRSIQDYSQSAQSLHTIASDVRRSTVAYIQEHAAEFPGVNVVEGSERSYPYGTLACHLLGYTGTITQEQLDKQKKDSSQSAGDITYESGDIVGQAGVEGRYESLLQGIRGEQTVRVDSAGTVVGQAGSVDPRPGSDIKLTISLKIQRACEEGLKIGMERAQGTARAGDAAAIVCLDCTNGEILGMASAPTFDPSAFVGGISSDDWDKLNSEEHRTPLVNRAIGGQYMSASTIKPLSSLAGMEFGVYSASQTTNCTGFWTGFGKSSGKWCWNHSGHGTINLRNGIVYSCDSVFYDVAKGFWNAKSDNDGLQQVFRRHGLGEATGVDLPSEEPGRVPDKDWKESYFKDWTDDQRSWNAGDLLNIVIGQGDILVTPIQMACVYAGIANGGTQYVPHVFLSAVARDGEGDAATYQKKERLTAKIHAKADLELIRDGLHGMPYEESASVAAHFNNLPVSVAAKTGTGEKSGEDEYGWFIAYAPFDKPQYVVACIIERGGFGAECAMPAVRNVLGAIYDSPDTSYSGTSDQTM